MEGFLKTNNESPTKKVWSPQLKLGFLGVSNEKLGVSMV